MRNSKKVIILPIISLLVIMAGCSSNINDSNMNKQNIINFEIDEKCIRADKDLDTLWEIDCDTFTLRKVSAEKQTKENNEVQTQIIESTTENIKSWQVVTEYPTEEIVTEGTTEKLKVLDIDTRFLEASYINQDGYPVGCELVTTQMLLSYYSEEITVDDMIDRGYVELAKFKEVNGKLYGGNPNKKFIGDPRDKHSYGCYVGTIEKLLNNYIADNNLQDRYEVVDLSNMQLIDICEQYVNYGIPVMVWATIDMGEANKNGTSWIDEDTDEIIHWVAGEHCLLLVGYDNTGYYFNDPLNGKAVHYDYSVVHERYNDLGQQAITMISIDKQDETEELT